MLMLTNFSSGHILLYTMVTTLSLVKYIWDKVFLYKLFEGLTLIRPSNDSNYQIRNELNPKGVHSFFIRMWISEN